MEIWDEVIKKISINPKIVNVEYLENTIVFDRFVSNMEPTKKKKKEGGNQARAKKHK